MECHTELVEALGNNALPYRTVARWIGKFQQGHASTSDEQRSGRLVSVRTNLTRAVIEQLMDYVKGNHQMARIVHYNDESVREGYIRNGGKEVKLFTSALKAFQCSNRIIMAQRKHLDNFLRGRIIRRLEWGRTQLEVSAKRNRRSTASDLSRQLSSATGTTVSRQTEYRLLGHIGLFSLQSDSRRTLIWRLPGTRYNQENTIKRHRYGGAGWLVWGGIILGFRTDLHVQGVTMAGHIYTISFWNNMYVCFGAPWVLDFCLWMTTPVLNVKHCRRMPSIGGYQSYGLASILTGHESNRACVGYAWLTNWSPSTLSHLCTGTSEGIA
ncbi:transposable element Tcb1 transposase [Trichonephila clavipes]|nr:transposable element Tcb1 transposase [Trichonephila clavipes]